MKVTRKDNKSGTVLSLEGELTIYTVAQAKQSLLEGHENFSPSVSLNLANVSEIDTAGLQLLLFLQKLLGGSSKKLSVSKSNEHVDSIFKNLDVTSLFALEN
ncbi:MAG: STAS domain-containing protein [Gammaproteobacteria bacterium]|nr:MAG: STAS domain-containing protein [Gammaproteobacteria bacterium]